VFQSALSSNYSPFTMNNKFLSKFHPVSILDNAHHGNDSVSLDRVRRDLSSQFLNDASNFNVTSPICVINKSLPVRSPFDVCSFWVADSNGMEMPKKLSSDGLRFSLHGYWPRDISWIVAESRMDYETFTTAFLSSEPYVLKYFISPNPENYCYQYREYLKHGHNSGYTYREWMLRIERCILRMINGERCFLRQCRYDKSRNCNYAQSCTLARELGRVGCKGESICDSTGVVEEP